MEPIKIKDILKQLPHRYPFVLIDRVLEAGEGSVHAIKNVTINEPFFVGHFPAEPIMPGVLIVEAMAQASIFVLQGKVPEGQIAFLAGIDHARFKKPVVPGDQLHLFANLDFFRRGMGKAQVRAEVDGVVVAEAQILFALAPA